MKLRNVFEGNYVEALPFHELITDAEPNKIQNHLSLVKCLLKLNQPNLALHYLDGLVLKKLLHCIK